MFLQMVAYSYCKIVKLLKVISEDTVVRGLKLCEELLSLFTDIFSSLDIERKAKGSDVQK